jgi:uncharacterized protein YrzB (UPF0473 family)
MQEKNNTITLTFDDGSEKDFEILFTYQSENSGKNYVFILDEGDQVGVLEYVEQSEGQGNIIPISPEDEAWDELEEVFESFLEEQENGCAGCPGAGSDECNGCSK